MRFALACCNLPLTPKPGRGKPRPELASAPKRNSLLGRQARSFVAMCQAPDHRFVLQIPSLTLVLRDDESTLSIQEGAIIEHLAAADREPFAD